MAVKTNIELKKQRKAEKKAKVDKITNWFMINLAWGVFGFIILRYMSNSLMMDYDPVTGEMDGFKNLLGKFSIIFGIIAIVLLVWGILTKFNVIKCGSNAKKCVKKLFSNPQRFINYGIFTAVLTLVLYYLSIYNKVRYYAIMNYPSWVGPETSFYAQEFWTTGGLSYAIGIYLLGAFIYTAIRVLIIEKKK